MKRLLLLLLASLFTLTSCDELFQYAEDDIGGRSDEDYRKATVGDWKVSRACYPSTSPVFDGKVYHIEDNYDAKLTAVTITDQDSITLYYSEPVPLYMNYMDEETGLSDNRVIGDVTQYTFYLSHLGQNPVFRGSFPTHSDELGEYVTIYRGLLSDFPYNTRLDIYSKNDETASRLFLHAGVTYELVRK